MVDAYVGFWFHCSPDPDLDEQSELCDRLHEQASELLKSLCLKLDSVEE